MKKYFVSTLLYKQKFTAIGFYDPATDILTIAKVERISNPVGMYDKEKLIKQIRLFKEQKFTVLLETRNKKFMDYSPIIALSDKGNENRLHQDIYFEYFKSMYESQEIDVGGDTGMEQAKALIHRTTENIDDKTGKVTYNFRKFDSELRLYILMVAAHVNPPRGVSHFLAIEKEFEKKPPGKTSSERIRYATGIAWDERLLKRQEKMIEATQKNFKY